MSPANPSFDPSPGYAAPRGEEWVAAMHVFSGLSEEDRSAVADRLSPESFRDGEAIIREGELGDALFLLLEGALEVIKGKDATLLDTLRPGDFFGEFSLIDRLPRSATVRSKGASRVARLSRKDFDPLLRERPSLAAAFYRNCLTETFRRFRDVTTNFTSSQSVLRETSRRLEGLAGDLRIAKSVQADLLRNDFDPANFPRLRIRTLYEPVEDVGGDHLDIHASVHGSLFALLADATGHGVSAALATGVLKSGFLFACEAETEASAVMRRLNRHYARTLRDLFATAILVEIDPDCRKARFVKAGHPSPLVWSAIHGRVEQPQARGICLGFDPDAEFHVEERHLAQGDRILLYSDGWLEQVNSADEEFGTDRLVEAFAEAAIGEGNPLSTMRNRLRRFSASAAQQDDISAILIEVIS